LASNWESSALSSTTSNRIGGQPPTVRISPDQL
jgi:hypothetical protein